MSTVSVLNTDAGTLSGKTLVNAESTQTITGTKTFDLDPNAPFAVSAGSAVVPNLIAERATGASEAYLGQLTFPAVQNPSAGVNVLDDYEEGTWTPAITGSGGGSGQTYTSQFGSYTKIGKLVYAQFFILLTNAGTITGSALISGLPFSSHATALSNAVGILQWNSLATTWVSMIISMSAAAATTLNIRGTKVAAVNNITDAVQADIANNTSLLGNITYIAGA